MSLFVVVATVTVVIVASLLFRFQHFDVFQKVFDTRKKNNCVCSKLHDINKTFNSIALEMGKLNFAF